ncbi:MULTISPECIES: PP2C family serine/threonine-protein phosphatase [Paenarthrobacter]|uniref:PP2C family serine/threonine-protein phosphatase n=1 Tax=Paenarthrobacter TaxID=1742992 RepID=UPI00074D2BDD|nr:PP2C family serine/threonine-protein phosphatase [Paenarthrobacter ureafaciens]AMB38821.1 serine/threonine protein phosphatase [Arthrobacter sp. ATCC 21022]KUR63129.1 serine/threonine protein phosphatase [Arthrobacter sp. ATCC 21022]RWW95013.1 serine/threonine-protein phosphatase [Paenarthrobacter ureafaciens]
MASTETTEGNETPAERPLIMRYAARSDVGRIRSKNDDSAYVGRHLAVVADGMGGHAGGDVASASTVLDMIHLDHDDYPDGADTVLADEIQTANSLLSELVHQNPKLSGMGTTVTALLLEGRKLHFAHIGDSRAYRLRNKKFEQISIDHTFVQRLIDEGRLRPEEAETHPHKNVLMRVLGDVDASPELDLDVLDVEPGERWLLCSDGLNYVAGHVVERMVREIKDLRECVETLVDLTLEAGAPDNVTVVMLEIAEETDDDVATAAVDIVPAAGATPRDEPDAVTASKSAEDAEESAASKKQEKEPSVAKTAGAGSSFSSGTPGSAEEQPDRTSPSTKPDATETAEATEDSKEPPATTDPNLGEHLSAEVLREELASRPHLLVGAAATAAETGSIPTVAGRTVARRAATVLTHKAEQDRLELPEPPRRRFRWLIPAVAAVVVLGVVVGLWLGYAWTQTRYYVGEFDQRVAIFNGISQRLGPIQLSRLEAVTDLRVDSLPEYGQQSVRQTVPAGDLDDAQRIVENLKNFGSASANCPSPSPSATATPSPTASVPVPSTAAIATPTPSPVPTPCEAAK